MKSDAIAIRETEMVDTEKDPEELGKLELKTQFVGLKAKGYSYDSIAKRLKVSKGTLSNWNQEFEEKIARLRAMELESLYEQYYMMKEGRIKLLGEMVEKLREEALSRDLSEIPADKVFDLLRKYNSDLQKEYVAVRPLSDDEIRSLGETGTTGGEMDGWDIAHELRKVLFRCRAGMITTEEAAREMALLEAMRKAREQGEMEAKLERIEAALLGRGR